MSQEKIDQAVNQLESSARRFDFALGNLHHAIEARSEDAGQIKSYLKDETSTFLKTSFEEVEKLSEQVIDQMENRLKGLIESVSVAAEDGLKLSNEKPLIFLGAVFGMGLLAGLIVTRKRIPALAADPALEAPEGPSQDGVRIHDLAA